MFTTILVGTDGSATAGRAVEVAARLAVDHGAALHVACAYGDPDEAPRSAIEQGGSVNAVLAAAARAASAVGVDATTHSLDVEPGDGLVAQASALDADLIVVGNRFLGGLQGYFMGSVPAKVLRSAPCSVLVVRTDEPDDGAIAVTDA